MARITIIDDDRAMDLLSDNLRYRGHEASHVSSFEEAVAGIATIVDSDVVVLDIVMSWPAGRPKTGLAGDHTAGMELLSEIRKLNRDLPIIVYTAIEDQGIRSALEADARVQFISKWESPSLQSFVARILNAIGEEVGAPVLQPFIVHGHNEVAKLALKNFLQNTLHLPEPIILHEQPNQGRTIIEKFEHYAAQAAIVFVLLTPDDAVAISTDSDEVKRRARQNVIFEMGYFLGVLGRGSGRVLSLCSGGVELPSDVTGVVLIDISAGIDAAGELIRREVEHADREY